MGLKSWVFIDDFCWGIPGDANTRPCRFYEPSDPRNCGIDLSTSEDAQPGISGSQILYSYAGGLILGYADGSGTLQLIIPGQNGASVTRYNYTHIALASVLLETNGKYVARGIQPGVYGPIGTYGDSEDDEHVDTVQVNENAETYQEPPWN